MGFAIGFLWMHEQLGRHWWPRILDHNLYAHRCVEQYVELADVAARSARRPQRGPVRSGGERLIAVVPPDEYC